jgi:hypothetical protein
MSSVLIPKTNRTLISSYAGASSSASPAAATDGAEREKNGKLAKGERSSIVVIGEPAADDSSFGVST